MPLLLAVVFVLLLLGAPAAHAAYPGQNGLIAFEQNPPGEDTEIAVVQPGGGTPVRLTDNTWEDTAPAWSPDGTKLAFVSNRDGNLEVYVMDADGSDVLRVTDNRGPDRDPSWSPDGTTLVFQSTRSSLVDLWVAPAGGGTARRLTTGAVVEADPAWSPDGATIVFEASGAPGIAGGRDLWAADADGTGVRSLGATPGSEADPAWAADGRRLLLTYDDGNPHVWSMAPAGGDLVKLSDGGVDASPAPSPDGRQVAFDSNRSGKGELYTMLADGSAETQRTSSADTTISTRADWQPVVTAEEPPTPTPTTATPTTTTSTSTTTTTTTQTTPADTTPTTPAGSGGGGSLPPAGGGGPATTEGGAPPGATCAEARVLLGQVEVLAACFAKQGTKASATGRVRVSGLDVVPRGTSRIEVDQEDRTIRSTGPVTVSAGGAVLHSGVIAWDFSSGRADAPVQGAKVRGIGLRGIATLVPDGVGALTVTANAALETALRGLLGRDVPEVSGTLVLRTANATGLQLRGVSLRTTGLLPGIFVVRRLDLRFEPGFEGFTGTAQVALPGAPPQVVVDAAVRVVNGQLTQLTGSASGGGAFGSLRLDRLTLALRPSPFLLAGAVAAGIGPALPRQPRPILRFDGSFRFEQRTFVASGRMAVVVPGIDVLSSEGSVRKTETSAEASLGFAARLSPSVGVSVALRGQVQRDLMLLQGRGLLELGPWRPTAEGAVSQLGGAFCAAPFGARGPKVGAGLRWGGAAQPLGDSCDVGAFVSGGKGLRTAQAGGAASVVVPKGLPLVVLAATGTTAAPRVTVVDPAGRRTPMPADPAAPRQGDVLVHEDTASRTTSVVVRAPRAGTWRLEPEPGSAVTAVRRADGLEQPQVRARVSGRGDRRTLRWTLLGQPGQVVRFVERGARTARTIATTRRSSGSVRFSPGAGAPGGRTVQAVVEQRGLVREQRTVARFTVAAPRRLPAPRRVGVRRSRGAAVATWPAVRGADGYDVRVAVSDGRRLVSRVRGRSLRVAAVDRRDRVAVTVAALSGDQRGTPRVGRSSR